jgi:hypothetical protein
MAYLRSKIRQETEARQARYAQFAAAYAKMLADAGIIAYGTGRLD